MYAIEGHHMVSHGVATDYPARWSRRLECVRDGESPNDPDSIWGGNGVEAQNQCILAGVHFLLPRR